MAGLGESNHLEFSSLAFKPLHWGCWREDRGQGEVGEVGEG